MSGMLHSRRHVNPHQIERARELAPHVRDAGCAPPLSIEILFPQDRRAMVERIEQLREPEGVLRQHRKLERPHHLFDDIVEARCLEYHGPETMVALVRELLRADAVESAYDFGFGESLPFAQLMEDVVGAHDSILQIWTSLPFEAERLGHIEHNQFAARELEHEIANRGDTDLPASARAIRFRKVGIALLHFRSRI